MFVEQERKVIGYLQETLLRLKAPEGQVMAGEALRFLRGDSSRFDIVFLDPPFGSKLLAALCAELQSAGHLAPDALVYLESEAEAGEPVLPAGWSLHRSKYAGKVGYHLARSPATGTAA